MLHWCYIKTTKIMNYQLFWRQCEGRLAIVGKTNNSHKILCIFRATKGWKMKNCYMYKSDTLLLNYLHMPGKLSCFISIPLLTKIFGSSDNAQYFVWGICFPYHCKPSLTLSPKELVVHYFGSFGATSSLKHSFQQHNNRTQGYVFHYCAWP